VSIADLQRNWRHIAAECATLPQTMLPFDREGKTHAEVAAEIVKRGPGWCRSWGAIRDHWLTWGIGLMDQYPLGDTGLPYTTSLLRACTGVRVAALSLFRPGCVLPVHSHPELVGCQTVHLGLSVPAGCYLWCDQFHQEREGKMFGFDGTRPHWAMNGGGRDRVILYLEIMGS
jgi:Aspartyl/Asparaginyl beta-hydroxylase